MLSLMTRVLYLVLNYFYGSRISSKVKHGRRKQRTSLGRILQSDGRAASAAHRGPSVATATQRGAASNLAWPRRLDGFPPSSPTFSRRARHRTQRELLQPLRARDHGAIESREETAGPSRSGAAGTGADARSLRSQGAGHLHQPRREDHGVSLPRKEDARARSLRAALLFSWRALQRKTRERNSFEVQRRHGTPAPLVGRARLHEPRRWRRQILARRRRVARLLRKPAAPVERRYRRQSPSKRMLYLPRP